MEDKDDNVVIKPKSIWKKSNFKKETDGKCKKNIRFNLNADVYLDNLNQIPCSEDDIKLCVDEPSPKKRKKEMDMPFIPNEVEREIEMQYHSKAKESKLTTRNVKTILKSVITNQYVVDMVRAAEGGGTSNLPFEPKLTRAKTKELLQQHAIVTVSPVVGLLTPGLPSAAELSPEVKLLIDKELSEDSSDEEYNPENEPEPSEDEEKGDVSVASDIDSLPATPASCQAPVTPVHETSFDWSQDGIFKVPQENVGQRTRSKLDFHNLPLECIEQAYVPPDITADMYETECDNPDWQDFLKEFTQPLVSNETLDDDPENDPEYNILEDEEKDPVDYKEEMRKDKAVKVSKKELNALMKELFETDTLSSDDDDAKTSESIAELEASIMKETEERQRREAEQERKKKQLGFHPNQKLLLAQQLRQHVQLTTQHFLQTYKHPMYHRHADVCKTMLVTLAGLKNDNICCQETYNIGAALDTVTKWEEIHNHPKTGVSIRKFVAEQIKAETKQKRNKRKIVQQFPIEMINLMMDSEVVLYPMLLPPAPFPTSKKPVGPYFFTSSEDMLLAICLEQVTQLMEENKDRYKRRCVSDICQIIPQMCIPRSSPHHIAAHIRKLKASQAMNPVKAFFQTGKPPMVCHFVIPVHQGKKLCEVPFHKLPELWRNFSTTAIKDKEILEERSQKCSGVQGKGNTSRKNNERHKIIINNVVEGTIPMKTNVTTKEVKTRKEQCEGESNKESRKDSVVYIGHKEIAKTSKKVTINDIIQNASSINTDKLHAKAKTTKKDISSMLAKANSIQNAVRLKGQFAFMSNELNKTNKNLVSSVNNNPKADSDISTSKNLRKTNVRVITKSSSQPNSKLKTISQVPSSKNKMKKNAKSTPKSNNKLKSCLKHIDKQYSISTLPEKVDRVSRKRSKNLCSGKNNAQFSNVNGGNTDFNNTSVPKIKFKVVSKAPGYLLKSETKKIGKYSEEQKLLDCENNKKDISGKKLPRITEIERYVLPTSCSKITSTPKPTDLDWNGCHGPQIHSESDSVQSNSIESERIPVPVNTVKSCVSAELNKPRPPSTVKLKEKLNSSSNFRLSIDTKVNSHVKGKS